MSLDFLKIATKSPKRGVVEVYPKFIIKKSSDLMIRGGDFYAIWVSEKGLWIQDEQECLQLIDHELEKYAKEHCQDSSDFVTISYMWDSDSGSIDRWHKYCQKQMRDNFNPLDSTIIFENTEVKKEDYASKRVNYALGEGDISAYDELISVLYSPEERHKIEWAIGSIINGDSKHIQKFLVLYGAAGTGKSTILNIIQWLFEGYWSAFDAKVLGSSNASFALEAFKSNPLVAIQHDGDLSRIEDNVKLNSLVAHETMTVNSKYERLYSMSFNSFLFMGTNRPVRITDSKSGLLRRLIDVSPTGEKIAPKRYNKLLKDIKYELGAIAWHCKQVYEENKRYYDNYIPFAMIGESNVFYDFMIDSYHIFKKEDSTTLAQAWALYKTYCEQANVPYPLTRMVFKSELKNYFRNFEERVNINGERIRSYYTGFRTDKFQQDSDGTFIEEPPQDDTNWLVFESTESDLDRALAECPAQYGNEEEKPTKKWENVTSKLKDLDTTKLHYVKGPLAIITVDFDIPDENGNKCLEKNIEAASKWPPTYAELSKSGQGIHLEYWYTGDPTKLARVAGDHIEIKVFIGNSSLRRKLTKTNGLHIATISSGLPVKEDKKVINFNNVKSEKGLRSLIERNLNKEIHPGTKPSVDFIYKILEDAYNDGLSFDVSDMRPYILTFAANSSHQSEYCLKLVNQMKFKSKDKEEGDNEEEIVSVSIEVPIIFFDVEVFPNLFVICWKKQGKDSNVVRMINPRPKDVEELLKFRLIGFNNRRYDNHILYAALMGYDNKQLYKVSQRIISGERNAFFGEAYNMSYTDIYDFSSKKQSLKKFEIELGIHHQELGLPWDQEVPEELWGTVADYCCNDVIATEAVFDARHADFSARLILASLSGLTPNDTNRNHITRILIGRKRSADHVYTDLSKTFPGYEFIKGEDKKMHNMYRGTDVGFGGYVYAKHGIYTHVALLDVGNMHGASIVALNKFGSDTKRYIEIRDARMAIKEGLRTGDYSRAKKMLDGKLAPYLNSDEEADALQSALKLILNSTYGIAAATFDNPLKDPRDSNNIIALRGALMMRTLQDEVIARGFDVIHIKTDSIKIPNATQEIIDFVIEFGERYGYEFEHEATYDRICLVNDAVYIAKYDDKGIRNKGGKHANEWTATGTQFQVPYVFKNLFSREPIIFEDLCETKSVSKGAIYIDMNEDLPDVSGSEKELSKLEEKYRKGKISDTLFESSCASLNEEIEKGHHYIFIGRVGQFCPIKSGCGGGNLYRVQDGKYYALAGTSGYRWLESEMVRSLEKEDDVDESYYVNLANEAVEAIKEYGDFDKFVADEPYICEPSPDFMNVPEGIDDEIPFN